MKNNRKKISESINKIVGLLLYIGELDKNTIMQDKSILDKIQNLLRLVRDKCDSLNNNKMKNIMFYTQFQVLMREWIKKTSQVKSFEKTNMDLGEKQILFEDVYKQSITIIEFLLNNISLLYSLLDT